MGGALQGANRSSCVWFLLHWNQLEGDGNHKSGQVNINMIEENRDSRPGSSLFYVYSLRYKKKKLSVDISAHLCWKHMLKTLWQKFRETKERDFSPAITRNELILYKSFAIKPESHSSWQTGKLPTGCLLGDKLS